jgi:hypothetical protein
VSEPPAGRSRARERKFAAVTPEDAP